MTKEEAIRKLQKQKAEYLEEWVDFSGVAEAYDMAIEALSAEPEQTEMIKEIRKWINSVNRGSADYFIVDKIEEIINKHE